MHFEDTGIWGARMVSGLNFEDTRGCFRKVFSSELYNQIGQFSWQQVNISTNVKAGTVRGLHYDDRMIETKLVSCISGEIIDLLFDLRPNSPTYGEGFQLKLTSSNLKSVLIPPGVAHGFQTLVDDTKILYLHSCEHSASSDTGINLLDDELNFNLPLEVKCISVRDRNLPKFRRL